MSVKVIVIPSLARRVIYATIYDELPTTGLDAGDLGYAVDRNVLYRWSGSAWQAITISSRHGVTANKGTAANYPESSLFQDDTLELLYMVISGAWKCITMKNAAKIGQYSGNAAANKEIAHSLGRIPLIIHIFTGGTGGAEVYRLVNSGGNGNIQYAIAGIQGVRLVNLMTSTHFYVGYSPDWQQSANVNAQVYYWSALG